VKETTSWHSDRLGHGARLIRWGHWGRPLLLFPTGGGDAEEAERNGLIGAIAGAIEAGKVKVYATDSIPAAERLSHRIPPEAGPIRLAQFDAFLAEEVLPAIRADCRSADVEIMTAGASIGAYHALAFLARHPDAVRAAICLSGTYDADRLLGIPQTSETYFAMPLQFLPGLEGPPLEALRRRFVILAHGKGQWEDPGQSWNVADVLGRKGVPNRVDEWGPEWDHDWATWRAMLPAYLEELA
jgi:esterase/lipase superfamily enzyme